MFIAPPCLGVWDLGGKTVPGTILRKRQKFVWFVVKIADNGFALLSYPAMPDSTPPRLGVWLGGNDRNYRIEGRSDFSF